MGPKVERLGRILAAWRPEVGARRGIPRSPRPRPLYRAVREAPCRDARGWRPARASRPGRASADGAARRGWPGAAVRLRIDRSTFGPTGAEGRRAGPNRPPGVQKSAHAGVPRAGDPDPLTEPSAKRRRLDGEGTGRRQRGAPRRGTPRRVTPRRGTPRTRDAQDRRTAAVSRAPGGPACTAPRASRTGAPSRRRSRPRRARAGRRRPARASRRRRRPPRAATAGRRAVVAAGEHRLVERRRGQVEAHPQRDHREADPVVVEASEPNTKPITAGPISSRPSATAPAKRGDREDRDPDARPKSSPPSVASSPARCGSSEVDTPWKSCSGARAIISTVKTTPASAAVAVALTISTPELRIACSASWIDGAPRPRSRRRARSVSRRRPRAVARRARRRVPPQRPRHDEQRRSGAAAIPSATAVLPRRDPDRDRDRRSRTRDTDSISTRPP